ncbi:MAG: S9 family peptidase [Asticcacaulis sp.]
MFLFALALSAAVQTAPVSASVSAPLQSAAKPAAIHRYGGLSLSPKGDRLLTLEATPGKTHTVIVIRDLTGKVVAEADPCAVQCRYGDTAWAPDGQSFAVVASDDKAGTSSLYSVPVAGGAATLLTSFTGLAHDAQWSPDGKTIAFLAVVNPHKQVGATQAGAKQVGEIGIASVIDEQRIATVSNPGDQPAFVSPADTWVYEFDWMKDGKGFVATAAKGDGDNNWWTAKLEAFAPGSERVIAAPKMQMNYPRAGADGKSVYFIGGLMSDFGPVGGDVYAVPVEGGTPVNLTPDIKYTVTALHVTSSGVIASAVANGEFAVARIEPGKPAEIVAHDVSGISVDATGKTAVAISESFTRAPRIVAGALQSMTPITHDNDGVTSPYTATNVSWTNEGFNVEGWLLSPPNITPGKTYPMVTIVHGGPSSAVTPRFISGGTVVDLLNAGYFVFEPNPRGSYGQGEAFVLSNRRDFGGGDLRDILAGIDAVEKVAPVDDKRLGIYGHSYGGLMSMWTVTHSNRFKAAVAGAGIANWSSYYGENGIDQWMIPFFGASFYDDPAIYDKLSPIRYIKDAKTPTFIYVGERDVECPAAQSLEFWHGLKTMGVETSLVIYEGEGHGIRSPEHNADLTRRILGWFGDHLGAGPADGK